MKFEMKDFPVTIRDNGRWRNRSLRVFQGTSAVATGGASGIGRALGRQLASLGCTVCLADRQLDEVVKAAAEIRDNGGKAMAAHLDVSSYSAVERVVREMVSRTGRLDYMFNNAGIAIGDPASLHDIDDWNRIVDVNLRGVCEAKQPTYVEGRRSVVNRGEEQCADHSRPTRIRVNRNR